MRKLKRLQITEIWQKILLSSCFLLNAMLLTAQVTLANQQAVNDFPRSVTSIKGSLNIGGSSANSDITNLSPLSNIKTIGGDLNITFNRQLTNLDGLGGIESVGGRIFITNNAQLSNCVAIFDLIRSGGIIISNNTQGCNSGTEIIADANRCGGVANNLDSDKDGVLDCADGCPFNPYKIANDACGCDGGYGGDSDGDGTIDCLDECPYDKNKIKVGNCGCGVSETPDSDGDGVYDCNDECPNNRYLTKKGICGCAAPEIMHVSMGAANSCNDQGTNDGMDDTYQAIVAVEFAWPPKLGAIRFRGATEHRFDFSNDNETQTAFSFDLTFPANGQKVDFTVEYIGNETCFYRLRDGGTAPSSYSGLVCDIPHNVVANVSGNQAQITWDYVADWMAYEYRYRPIGTTQWIYQWTDQNEVTICDLMENQEYEYGVRSYCGDDRQSDFASSVFTAGEGETACLASTGNDHCVIQNLEIVNIQKCYDRGTAYPLDDYFYADVMVYFQNPPMTGVLSIAGNTAIELNAAELVGQTNYRFRRLKIMENGGRIDLTATFSAEEECTYNINYLIPDNPCSLDSRGRSRTSLAIDSEFLINELTVSPNPAHDVLRVSLPNLKGGQLMLFDILGKQVWTEKLSEDTEKIDLTIAHFENGMYQLIVQQEETIFGQKFIKQ